MSLLVLLLAWTVRCIPVVTDITHSQSPGNLTYTEILVGPAQPPAQWHDPWDDKSIWEKIGAILEIILTGAMLMLLAMLYIMALAGGSGRGGWGGGGRMMTATATYIALQPLN